MSRKKCWTLKTSLRLTDSVTILQTIAKIVWKDVIQRNVLQKHRGSSEKGCSKFGDVLNRIADNLKRLNKECTTL